MVVDPRTHFNMSSTTPTEDATNLQQQDELDRLNAAVTKQGSAVRELKKSGGSPDEIAAAVAELQTLKQQAATLGEQLQKNDNTFNRKAFDDLVLRKMFVVPAFEIHGGVKGLYDLGPPACALKVCKCMLLVFI